MGRGRVPLKLSKGASANCSFCRRFPLGRFPLQFRFKSDVIVIHVTSTFLDNREIFRYHDAFEAVFGNTFHRACNISNFRQNWTNRPTLCVVMRNAEIGSLCSFPPRWRPHIILLVLSVPSRPVTSRAANRVIRKCVRLVCALSAAFDSVQNPQWLLSTTNASLKAETSCEVVC